jgi:hypothetical protein
MPTEKNQAKDPAPNPGDSGPRKLAVSVTVHAERGPVVYQAGDTPTPEHAGLIANPDVWV